MAHQGLSRIPQVNGPTIARFHLDLGSLDLVHEDLLIRRRLIAVARPTPRDIERLAGIAARIEREGAR